jgi:hypothetical protein
LFSGVFTAEEFEEAGYKGSGDATLFDVLTFLQALLNLSLRSAFFWQGE